MSSVFFKFKSQREPSRVTFDGTGISVFELKREIINISRLGDGTDFDLTIYNEDTNEEYDDDTTIIPRSTSVIARRLPAPKPGQGRAARYVSGKMPVKAKNSYRTEQSVHSTAATSKPAAPSNASSAMDKAQTEEERIKAMFEMGGDQWEQQKQHMSNASRVPIPGLKQKHASVPDHPPPPGYVCYRCGKKGHWIQACPTNDNPEFDGKPRIKRITGIPRSFLKTVEEPTAASQDGLTDDARLPTSVMVNAEGDRVVAVPDQASWNQYQEKAQASAARQDVNAGGSKELQERGLECSIDKRLFVDPMKTPCCKTTYCHECIENALINSDLVCPNCSTEGVLLDDLAPDEEMSAKIRGYEEEKKAEKRLPEKVESPKASSDTRKPEEPSSSTLTPKLKGAEPPNQENAKKRPAEDEADKARKPPGPAAMQKSHSSSSNPSKQKVNEENNGFDQAFIDQMNALAPPESFNNMSANTPNASSLNPPIGMSMTPMMGMPQQMMNPMMGQWGHPGNMGNMGNTGMPGMPGFQQWGMNGAMFNGNMPFAQQQNWAPDMNMMNMNNAWAGNTMQPQQMMPNMNPNQRFANGRGGMGMRQMGGFANQQHSQPSTNEDDNAYMRKPVNPHRHQGRQKKIRPTDYRELGDN